VTHLSEVSGIAGAIRVRKELSKLGEQVFLVLKQPCHLLVDFGFSQWFVVGRYNALARTQEILMTDDKICKSV